MSQDTKRKTIIGMVVPRLPSTGVAGGDPGGIIGQELRGYTITRKLAEGGMGIVYEGEHKKIGRRAAIKVLKLELCGSEEALERFCQEARAVNAIRHENIVDIYEFGRDPFGRAFFVMELLEGEPLSARIRRGAVPWLEAFPILEQTLRALKAAHDKGFIHRDLKPDNIWLRYVEGRVQVKLLDFGIAKLIGADKEKLTQTGSAIGTPHYMSPEQINGARDIDHRTDIYAMGVITYEMFAGTTPFGGETLQALILGHLFQDPPRLAELPPSLGVPPPLAEIVDRMLVKDAPGRYQSVTDVLADLHDINAHRWPARAETMNRARPTRPPPLAALQAGQTGQTGQTGPIAPIAQTGQTAQTVQTGQTTQATQTVDKPHGRGRRAIAVGGAIAAAGLAFAGVATLRSQQGDAPAPAPAPTVAPAPPPSPAPAAPVEKLLDHDALRRDAQMTLRASLREAEPAVRVQGSDAIAKIKDASAVPALSELTERDPDAAVRGHAGEALGALGAATAKALLARLEADAPPPLQVWYASALTRLGDAQARARLLAHARSKDLDVSFKAALTLAELSQPGDLEVLKVLFELTAHEAKLSQQAPYAGALLLTKMAALRDAGARKRLYDLLESPHEGARLAAAEGLGKLGDDTGKQVLQAVLGSPASPHRLAAAVALIPLGEYGGFDVITASLGDKDPKLRHLAARALGEIGERRSLRALLDLAGDKAGNQAGDKDWLPRITAAVAILAIVGLDPQVLAQESVDWTKTALDSDDWAVRKTAADVLGDVPDQAAVPLLAQAIGDPDAKVRLAAARSAAKMKGAAAAVKLAAALKAEADPGVKEQQIKALGEIGSAAVRDTLARFAGEPGRLGVLAAGALIAVGDTSGAAKLETAVAAPQTELRLAAVQAAARARNPIVVPTLKRGVGDRVLDVRLAAAEGLATFNAEKPAAVKVLTAALGSKDASIVGRAAAALLGFGEQLASTVRPPAELLDSTDPKLRLAAVPIVRAMPPGDAVPLLRRLVADPDRGVRHAGVDAIASVAARDKDQAIKLYKSLVRDADPAVRAKAAGQLSRLVPPARPAAPAPQLTAVKKASGDVTAASAEAVAKAKAFEALAQELAATTAAAPRDDEALQRALSIAKDLGEAAAQLEGAAAKVEAAAKTAAEAAGPSPAPDAAKLVEDAQALAQAARDAATAARDKVAGSEKQAQSYAKTWTEDPQLLITAADTAIATGRFAEAKQSLEKAAKLLARQGGRSASIDYSYAQLYDKMATRTKDPAGRRQLLQQAADAYQQFAKTGTGSRVRRARARAAEIADDLKELGPP
ncbi:MAG TPA: HEAT repeat domain-containing protein [Kofleriaceae bacterium]|nr:HEAT repeat domain-containing protein [Kofleriaceae bacterium]